MNGFTPLPVDSGSWAIIWNAIAQREQEILSLRVNGLKLDEIGRRHGLTRERIRQLIIQTEDKLIAAADELVPEWRDALGAVASQPVVPGSTIGGILATSHDTMIDVLCRASGFEPARAWGGTLRGWWTAHPDALAELIDAVTSAAPMRSDELETLVAATCGDGMPAALLFQHRNSPIVQGPVGNWLRRRFSARDTVYMLLLERGEPCRIVELMEATNSDNTHTFRESLRRDDRFRQIRPAGTWALTEWKHIDMPPWSNAVEALVQTVSELGPIGKEALFARVIERYPVTPWRLQQCLLHDEVGLTPNGEIDLVSRGAVPIEEPEPTRPSTIACDPHGNVIGVRLTVDKDLMRGSGVVVSHWLTWKLGLRHSPMSRTFDMGTDFPPLTVRRATSAAQISTLRQHAQAQDMKIGCQLIVLLRADESTAKVVHACPSDRCDIALPNARNDAGYHSSCT